MVCYLQPSLKSCSFFTVEERRDRQSCTRYLAYIQEILVERDGRLIYRAGFGLKRVIEANDIHELIGLVRNNDRQYIIRHSCLF